MPRPLGPEEAGRPITPERAEEMSLTVMRQQFLAQPADKQQQTLAYVERLLSERPTSYLARIARNVYGPITEEELEELHAL